MINDVLVLTTNELGGYEIEEIHGYISINFVTGADFIKDFFAGFTSFFGGISKAYTEEIDNLKEEAIRALEKKAMKLNMNCILAVKIDLDPIFSNGYSMFMVSATGTAVRLKNYKAKSNNGAVNENEIKKALQKAYTATSNNIETYDYTKISFRQLDDYLYEFSDEQIKRVIDSILKTYTDAYSIAALEENKKKMDLVAKHIIQNDLLWAIEYLHEDMDRGKALLVRDMNIVNYRILLNNFKDNAYKGDKNNLFIAFMAKPLFLNKEQFMALDELVKYLDNVYSDEVETKLGGAFKKKTVWVCKKCGNGVDLTLDYCPNCEVDKLGLKSSLKAKVKIEHLKNIRDVIAKFYIK